MPAKPLVLVIMPVYNNEGFVAEAIESILKQTYTNFEFIIIDDHSTDSSWTIIQSYAKKDKRIRAVRNRQNLKIVATRNKGFKMMHPDAKYVAIFDSDDVSLPKRLEKEVSFLEQYPSYGLVGGHTHIIDGQGNHVRDRHYETDPDRLQKRILFESPVAQPACMIRREALEKVGWYSTDGKFDRSRDFDLWVRIADLYNVANLDAFVLNYRVSSTQGKRTHLKETIRSTIQVQSKWLWTRKYFSFGLLLRVCLEHVLLLLPQPFVLKLFEHTTYKTVSVQ